jgi:ribosome-binding factor A
MAGKEFTGFPQGKELAGSSRGKERQDRDGARGRGEPAREGRGAGAGRERSAPSTFKPQGKKHGEGKPAGNERIARVAERIRTDLANMFLLGIVRDPDAQGAVVSSVKLTNDLSLARVFMRLVEIDPSEARKKALLKSLERAKGHIRHELAIRLDLRSVPELRFAWDETTEINAHMDALFAEVEADRKRFAPSEPEET